jgi:diaminohydroxyphosphoribosylaminopyrimidine deaminase/5-amino-6-(5-phosphoribosylamino)uracil reductase
MRDQLATDTMFMDFACRLARRGQGRVSPNPSVGCVLVNPEGVICALARTDDGGRPHAEMLALQQTDNAKGATAYVTLEPCAHEGSTPSCARMLAEAGLNRVVIGCLDPDPRTAGRGAAILRAAGVEVVVLDAQQALRVQAGFLHRINDRRPFVTLKLAMSADGFMRTADDDPPHITGAEAQRRVHMMRAEHDAILTGIGTVENDDPQLTARLDGLRSPVPYIADTTGRFPSDCKLDRAGAVILTKSGAAKANFARILRLEDMEIGTILSRLAASGVNWLMVEAGPRLSRSVLQSGFVDRLVIFTAPHDIALAGQSDYDWLELAAHTARMEHVAASGCGVDHMDVWERGDL